MQVERKRRGEKNNNNAKEKRRNLPPSWPHNKFNKRKYKVNFGNR
jgi:hypothetical protein